MRCLPSRLLPSILVLLVCGLLVSSSLTGCPSTADPCELDRYQCDDQQDTWPEEPVCDLEGALTLELGEGNRAFSLLETDTLPELTNGAQGGSHMFLGIRILNPALDLYDKFLVEFNAFHLESVDSAECDPTFYCENCGYDPETTVEGASVCRLAMGWRRLTLGGALPLRVLEDGTVEEFGFMVFMPPAGYVGELSAVELRLRVQDPCGREGLVTHVVVSDTGG